MISVIIPIYNVEKYLPQCLESVINQTYRNLEVICINDGSPDNSLEILEEYKKKDSRIKVINQQNQGLAGARNTGLDIACGEFIFFLDSDDWLPLNAIELLYNKQKEEKADIVIGGRSTITFKKELEFLPKDYGRTLTFEEYIEKSFKDSNFRAVAWGKLYKREIIQKNKLYFPKGLLYEDLLFVMKYLYYSNKIVILSKDIYNYRYNRENSIVNSINIKDIDCLKNVDELERFFIEKKFKEILEKDYYVKYIMEWIIYATIGKFFKKSIEYKFFKKYIIELKKNKIFIKYTRMYLKLFFTETCKMKLIFIRNKVYLYLINSNKLYLSYLYILIYRIIIKVKK